MNIVERTKNRKGIFYNALYPYYQSKPYFLDVKQIAQTELLEKNCEVFLREFLAYNAKGLTKNDLMRTGRGYQQQGLRTVTLLTNMYRYHKRCAHFPETMKILEAIPELSLVSINVLSTGIDIMPHYGETDATHRCHLGLIVPAGMPLCGIRVGNELRGWEEGKVLAFIDGNRHKVWNHSGAERVVLMVDFIRPEITESKWSICGKIWASVIITGLIVRWGFLKRTPFFIAEFILAAFGFAIMCGIRLQRALHFEVPFISRN